MGERGEHGTGTGSERPLSVTQPESPPAPIKWYYRPAWVLILLFVVLGPLALPYLWKSPSFSHRLKVVLTALVLVYTALLIDQTIRIVLDVQEELKALLTVDAF
jgi:hypothetical protein